VGHCNLDTPTEDEALASSLRLATASGSLEALLKYLCTLLRLNDSSSLTKEVWDQPLGPTHVSAAQETANALQVRV
jgi:hypothetical protein